MLPEIVRISALSEWNAPSVGQVTILLATEEDVLNTSRPSVVSRTTNPEGEVAHLNVLNQFCFVPIKNIRVSSFTRQNGLGSSPFHSPMSASGGQPLTAVSQNAGQVPTAVGEINSPWTS